MNITDCFIAGNSFGGMDAIAILAFEYRIKLYHNAGHRAVFTCFGNEWLHVVSHLIITNTRNVGIEAVEGMLDDAVGFHLLQQVPKRFSNA